MLSRMTLAVAVTVGATAMLGATTVPAAAGTPTCEGLTATIVGTDGDDDLHGTDGPDVAWLGPGDDSFNGRAGDDVVCAGDGSDHVEGGRGDDHLYGEAGHFDGLIGGLGSDVIHGGPGTDHIYGEPLGTATADKPGADAPDQLFGDEGDDALYLWSGDGSGGGGADTVDGGDGVDLLSYAPSERGVEIDVAAGTATGDAVDTFTGMEQYQGSRYSDVLVGTDGPDHLDGHYAYGDAQDLLVGGRGDDWLRSVAGTVRAGPGDDRFVSYSTGGLRVDLGRGDDLADVPPGFDSHYVGGPGRDRFLVADPEDGHDYEGMDAVVRGSKGFDTLDFSGFFRAITVETGHDRATARHSEVRFHHIEEYLGTAFDDVLRGTRGHDRFHGGPGDDLLRGGPGGDLLVGDDGDDVAYGGRGRDVCEAERRYHC